MPWIARVIIIGPDENLAAGNCHVPIALRSQLGGPFQIFHRFGIDLFGPRLKIDLAEIVGEAFFGRIHVAHRLPAPLRPIGAESEAAYQGECYKRVKCSHDLKNQLAVTVILSIYTRISCGEKLNRPGEPFWCAVLCGTSILHFSGSGSPFFHALARTVPEPSCAISTRAFSRYQALGCHLKSSDTRKRSRFEFNSIFCSLPLSTIS